MKNVKNRFLVLLTLLFTGSSLASATKQQNFFKRSLHGNNVLFSDYCQDIKISAKQNSSKRIFGRLAKTRKSKINQKQI